LWLAAAGVHVLEAYTLPFAAAALALGFSAHRRDPSLGSWVTLAPGLILLLAPSIPAALGEHGVVRLAFLTAAAFACVVLGALWRLRAPVLLGGATLLVLAVDAARPIAEGMPRWIPIGVVGAALLWLGGTYERRISQLRAMRASLIERLH
jgi:hypothetical protein